MASFLAKGEMHMPTILVIMGWRLYFYSNEGNEPIHIHCKKAESECKYWLDVDIYEIREAYGYNMSPQDKRSIRKIIFDHFDYIVAQWDEFMGGKDE